MATRRIKGLAVVVMAIVGVIPLSLGFQPTNLSLPYQLIIPFIPSHTLSMFLLCNAIIVAVILTTLLGSPRKSNGVASYDDDHHVFMSTGSFRREETHNSNNQHLTHQRNLICTDEDAGAQKRYDHSKSEKKRCRDTVNYTENGQVDDKFLCSSVPREQMQLVEIPPVIDSKRLNELASMIDEDFNRTVEEFISKFKSQLHVQTPKSFSRRLQP